MTMGKKYKILSEDVVKSLIDFLDEVQFDAAGSGDKDSMHKVNFCNWAIQELLNSFDGFLTTINKDKDKIKPKPKKTKRDEIIDEHFIDWELPEDMTDDEFEKLVQNFERFVKGWEKEYNKDKPKSKKKKKTDDWKPRIEDVSQHCSLDEIADMLLDDPELTKDERFELYYEEHKRVNRKKEKTYTLDELLKGTKIKRNKGYNDKGQKRK